MSRIKELLSQEKEMFSGDNLLKATDAFGTREGLTLLGVNVSPPNWIYLESEKATLQRCVPM